MQAADGGRSISKILSANDTGDTGGHQAGLLVPKEPEILEFFPRLDKRQKNPRYHLAFYDESDTRWEFAFIYYNNKFFGGTRNEYRLTRMTPFMRMSGLHAGDELILQRDNDGRRHVRYKRRIKSRISDDGILRLGSSWKVIDI